MMKVYQVYACKIRNAQIYTGLGPETDDAYWKNFEQEPLVDIVMAESEEDACAIVAGDENISPDVLYAIEQTADITSEINGETVRTEATAYTAEGKTGIEILLPDKRIARVETDENGRVSVYEMEQDSDIIVRLCCI